MPPAFRPLYPSRSAQPGCSGSALLLRWARWGALFLAFLSVSLLADSSASGPPKKHYQVPAGDAVATLKQFAEQSGEQIVYLIDTVRGVQTHAIDGELTTRQALDRMLGGTGLQVFEDQKTGALTVRRPPAAK